MTTLQQTLPRALRRTRWPKPSHTRRRHAATAAAPVDADRDTTTPPLDRSPPPAHSFPTTTKAIRREAVKDAAPFSDFLTDTFSRQHNYLRISLTEKCNLRCLYCMPEDGVPLQADSTQLTTPEIQYLSALFVSQGVNKIRLTGGEPTVRKDILPLMKGIGALRSKGLKELALTTNGISLHRKLDAMVDAGLTGVNISLDTLDPFQFTLLTRRNGFAAVRKSIDRVIELNKAGAAVKLKVNVVVMRGLNDDQILPFVEMTRDEDIEVRFIEYMPFDGNAWSKNKMYPYTDMLTRIRSVHPSLYQLRGEKNDTSKTWAIPGFTGRLGFITSMTHNFCGSCNRLRITSDGNLKVCLFGDAEVSLRDALREGFEGRPMSEEDFATLRRIEKDGDGQGWAQKERDLLNVIGPAVKRKKEKHAGMGELENMPNRPMILIGG